MRRLQQTLEHGVLLNQAIEFLEMLEQRIVVEDLLSRRLLKLLARQVELLLQNLNGHLLALDIVLFAF